MRTVRTLFRFVLIGGLVTVGIVFTLQNSQETTVSFGRWAAPTYPLALILLVAFVGGFLIAGLYFLIDIMRMKSQLRKSQKMCELLEREVDTLRNQPLLDENETTHVSPPDSVEQHITHEGQPESSLDLDPKKVS